MESFLTTTSVARNDSRNVVRLTHRARARTGNPNTLFSHTDGVDFVISASLHSDQQKFRVVTFREGLDHSLTAPLLLIIFPCPNPVVASRLWILQFCNLSGEGANGVSDKILHTGSVRRYRR
jgi:hypothetical protein